MASEPANRASRKLIKGFPRAFSTDLRILFVFPFLSCTAVVPQASASSIFPCQNLVPHGISDATSEKMPYCECRLLFADPPPPVTWSRRPSWPCVCPFTMTLMKWLALQIPDDLLRQPHQNAVPSLRTFFRPLRTNPTHLNAASAR
jgi:hypothetical protein